MTFENEEQAYKEGKAAGKKSLTRDVIMFVLASLFAFGTEYTTWEMGVKHGVSLAIASDYVKRAVAFGYAQGAADAAQVRP